MPLGVLGKTKQGFIIPATRLCLDKVCWRVTVMKRLCTLTHPTINVNEGNRVLPMETSSSHQRILILRFATFTNSKSRVNGDKPKMFR